MGCHLTVRALLLAAALTSLLGCQRQVVKQPPVLSNAVPGPKIKPIDPRQSRRALVTQAFERLAAGDTDGLLALADPNDAFQRGYKCNDVDDSQASYRGRKHRRYRPMDPKMEAESLRWQLGNSVDNAKGLAIAVLEVPKPDPETDTGYTFEKGNEMGACTVKQDIRYEDIHVTISVTRGTQLPYESKVTVAAMSVGGRWYLTRLPRRLADKAPTPMAPKMNEYADKLCACPDQKCADAIEMEMMRWHSTQMEEQPDADPGSDDQKAMSDAMMKMSTCFSKLAAQQQAAPPPTATP